MLLTASTTWYLEDMRQDHLWTFQCPTAILGLLISERLQTTTTTTNVPALLSSISTCFQACLWMMESLKNFQILRKKKGGLWRRRWLLEMTIVQAEIGMMQSICDLLPMLSAYMAIKYFLLTYLIIMQLCKKNIWLKRTFLIFVNSDFC